MSLSHDQPAMRGKQLDTAVEADSQLLPRGNGELNKSRQKLWGVFRADAGSVSTWRKRLCSAGAEMIQRPGV